MKAQLKTIIEKLPRKTLNLKSVNITSFKKLGIGEGNINYLLKINNKKFICRINIDRNLPNKSKSEFKILKKLEKSNITPDVFYLHKKDKQFPFGFIILEYLEGKSWRMRKRQYTERQIKQLAIAIGKLHTTKINNLKKTKYKYSSHLYEATQYTKSINKYSKNMLKSQLKEIHKKISQSLPKKEKHKFTLIHDDLCPQNIIQQKDNLKIIDWESIKYSDPAKDISRLIIDFELKGTNLQLFLKTYSKFNKDKNILQKATTYNILDRYVHPLWELERSFEIIHKKLPKEYLQKTTVKEHINEAKRQYRQLQKLIKLPNLEIDQLF